MVVKKKIYFDESKVGKNLTAQYGIPKEFSVFRYAYRMDAKQAQALFIVRFQLKKMDVRRNIQFSKIPMQVLIRLKGFRSKYWLCEEKTNTCMGVYRWATIEDARKYLNSIAMWFMKKRSVPGSVSFEIKRIEGDR